MKNKLMVFGFIALAVLFVFSMAACDNAPKGDVETSFNGSWYSSVKDETFTFTIAEGASSGDFVKMQNDGSGERGTFTYTATRFTTTIVEYKKWVGDNLSDWLPFVPTTEKSGVEPRDYKFGVGSIKIWTYVYTKQP